MTTDTLTTKRVMLTRDLFRGEALREALVDSFRKLSPRDQIRNPVMFVVYVGAILTTILLLQAVFGRGEASPGFILHVTLWLWFTVLFANFAEAAAEGRAKAQAATLRGARREVMAKKLEEPRPGSKYYGSNWVKVTGSSLRRGDVVVVEPGDFLPADGDVIEGVGSVDESAITGESAPVIREAGGDFSSVTGGTRLLSDWLVVRVTSNPGETFLDRMISMVEAARRQKTPNEIALAILLAVLTLIFLLATATLLPYSIYSVDALKAGEPISITTLVALLVCLIPTTIGALLSAIGVAGIGRLISKNVIAMSGRAVEAAGDVDVLLLDKTGTITLGNRQASALLAAPGVSERELGDAAQLASLPDETPEGRSVVVLAKQKLGLRERDVQALHASFVKFSALTRMSGVDLPDRRIRKGAADSVRKWVTDLGGLFPNEVQTTVEQVARRGSTPLVVAEAVGRPRVLGVIELKDIVKGGIKERFAELRRMGIKTVMITGDNRLTAAAIAAEAGVDDFLPEATPEAKLTLIRRHQTEGRLVAMTGDGTNDAPALAQADVAVAMNTGTQAAKEAGNMVDLDSNPTKLIEIVETGKQMLMTRGALTTFSIANDVAKYFAIIPAAFVVTYPQLGVLNVMQLATPQSAILSAVIFNALIIIALIPLALKGVRYRPMGAGQLLRSFLLVYGLGGIILPFIGIKLIDMVLVALGLRSARYRIARPRGAGVREPRRNLMFAQLKSSVLMLIALSVLTGVLYPLVVTGIAQAGFSSQASGSLIERDGKAVGSVLIGQPFSDPKYFWSRPSATGPVPYNAAASSGSNQGPLNPALADAVKARIEALRNADPDNQAPVPVDLVTASASGLDPHITPAAAEYQAARVARARGLAAEEVQALVAAHTEGRQLGFLGEPRVNVLELNLALEARKP